MLLPTPSRAAIPGLRFGHLPQQVATAALCELKIGLRQRSASTLELGVGFAAMKALQKLRSKACPKRARKVWAAWCRQRFQDVRPLSEFPACHHAIEMASAHFGVPKQLGELNVILRSYDKGDWLGRHVDDVRMFAEPVLATILKPGGQRDGLCFSLPQSSQGLAAARADAEAAGIDELLGDDALPLESYQVSRDLRDAQLCLPDDGQKDQ